MRKHIHYSKELREQIIPSNYESNKFNKILKINAENILCLLSACTSLVIYSNKISERQTYHFDKIENIYLEQKIPRKICNKYIHEMAKNECVKYRKTIKARTTK